MKKIKYILIIFLMIIPLFLTACTNCERKLYAYLYGDKDCSVTFYIKNKFEIDFYYKFETKDGSRIKKPEDPVLEGYTFIGWYVIDDNRKNKHFWNFENDIPIKDITLYTEWEPITIKVTFNTNGGKENFDDILLTYDTFYNFKDYIPTRENDTFLGWYDESGYRKTSGTSKYTKDITLTAKWESNT